MVYIIILTYIHNLRKSALEQNFLLTNHKNSSIIALHLNFQGFVSQSTSQKKAAIEYGCQVERKCNYGKQTGIFSKQ